jgi:hypothetical protein
MKNKEPQINITFWNFNLFAKGEAAVTALRVPIAFGFLFVIITFTVGIAWRAGWIL